MAQTEFAYTVCIEPLPSCTLHYMFFLNDVKNLDSFYRICFPFQENIWTIPNLLCLIRITASPYLGYLVLAEEYLWAFGLVAGAAVTDLVSGKVK